MTTTRKARPEYFGVDKKNYRIFEIDFIRGILIILVMLDHIMFDFHYFGQMWLQSDFFLSSIFFSLSKAGIFYLLHPARIFIRECAIMLFFLLSGISATFSKSNLKRGLIMLGFGALLTVFSNFGANILNATINIDFNIIHAVALSTLIYYLIKRTNPIVKIVIGFAVIALTIILSNLDIIVTTKFFLPFGILPVNYSYADFLALIPGLAFFLFGAVFGEKFYPTRKSLLPGKERSSKYRPVLYIGRHSLWFYLGQQAVAFAVFTLIGIIFNFF